MIRLLAISTTIMKRTALVTSRGEDLMMDAATDKAGLSVEDTTI